MGNLVAGLDPIQELALLQESWSTRNLLGYGVKVIREGAFLETTRDPVLTLLSIGIEKLYKLSVGAIEFSSTGAWPAKATMKAFGHSLHDLHATVFGALSSPCVVASATVRSSIAAVMADPVVTPLVDALDAYGRMGRFYYLDELGNAPQSWKGPDDAWNEVESAALLDPELARMRDRAFSDVSDKDAFNSLLTGISTSIADTVDRVWDCVTLAGENHLMGRAGQVLGAEANRRNVGRQ